MCVCVCVCYQMLELPCTGVRTRITPAALVMPLCSTCNSGTSPGACVCVCVQKQSEREQHHTPRHCLAPRVTLPGSDMKVMDQE